MTTAGVVVFPPIEAMIDSLQVAKGPHSQSEPWVNVWLL